MDIGVYFQDGDKSVRNEEKKDCIQSLNVFILDHQSGALTPRHGNEQCEGSNDCDRYSFDETAFRSDMNTFIYACLSRGVSVVFMSVMKRSGPWYCTPDEHTVRREIVNKMMKSIALENHFVHYFKPTNVYRVEYEARDGIHFTEEGYRAFLVALRKSLLQKTTSFRKEHKLTDYKQLFLFYKESRYRKYTFIPAVKDTICHSLAT
ncbi:unnamed protein product [Mytilus edulis]|uniref:Uncharacterized protein n=1 Tax=Mytilus edulis TaxID=6550 RepID=A0A8S3PMJ2_MYTED|nr:unnamed protein product [Mytilus edulis]